VLPGFRFFVAIAESTLPSYVPDAVGLSLPEIEADSPSVLGFRSSNLKPSKLYTAALSQLDGDGKIGQTGDISRRNLRQAR
jgi:hypothetical protein